MLLIYANLCKNIQIWLKMTISTQIMTNGIQRQLCFHVLDIKEQTYLLILEISFSYMSTDASNLCKFMGKNFPVTQKCHHRAKAPLLR